MFIIIGNNSNIARSSNGKFTSECEVYANYVDIKSVTLSILQQQYLHRLDWESTVW